MTFYASLFPVQYGYGSVGGPRFKVEVVKTPNKRERRNVVWTDARRRYDLSMSARDQSQLETINAYHMAMGGPEHSFLFWDYADFELSSELIGSGNGVDVAFQVTKTYTYGSATHVRDITKPRSGLAIYVNDILQTSGVSVSTTTGIVTFTSAPAGSATIKVTGRFDVPVRFVEEELFWRVVDRTESAGDEGDYLYVPESLNLIEVIGE